MSVVDRSFDNPLKLEERAAMPLAGGIVLHGYQCGMLWGAALAAGAQAYRVFGPGPQAEAAAIVAAQRLVASFRAGKDANCRAITGVEFTQPSRRRLAMQIFKVFITLGFVRCFRLAAKYAPVAAAEIDTALAEQQIAAPSPPVSCAALVAEKMGASAMHVVMAAGLAGGIGLSGGGCGALGAAIWIIAMDGGKEKVEDIGMSPPRANDAIDRFVKSAGPRFECSEIVGRRFENVDDHAAYLRDGGCSEIIKVLAAS